MARSLICGALLNAAVSVESLRRNSGFEPRIKCARKPRSGLSSAELLYLRKALQAILIGRAGGITAHPETMAIEIFNVHFPNAPGHICRRLTNDRTALPVLLMKCVHENGHPHASLPLRSFTEENLAVPQISCPSLSS